jgi:putative transposase
MSEQGRDGGDLHSLRRSVKRGLPFGDDKWTRSSAVRLALETTTRPRGRPRKETLPRFGGRNCADYSSHLAPPR